MSSTGLAVSVVMITRNRRSDVMRTLPKLLALPERPAVIMVDNGSDDGTCDAVHDTYPNVRVLALGRNAGAAARNVGVRVASTPYVAFADDDSWWERGALSQAVAVLDAHPRLAVLAGRVRVGQDRIVDPTCIEMACSPLGVRGDLPGPSVLGFIACGAVVRSRAFLAVGGFDEMLQIGGEEGLLAIDLAAAGWQLCYCDSVVAIHEPSRMRDRPGRERVIIRNELWSAWLRRPLPAVTRKTARVALAATYDPQARQALLDALREAPTVVRRRRPVPPYLEGQLRTLEASSR